MVFYNNLQIDRSKKFPLIHHYEMLRDKSRMISYFEAIQETINEKDTVVDIGTGTGILAHFACLKNPADVFAIEYNEPTFEIAKEICNINKIKNIKLLKGRSYDIDITAYNPTVLLTETIGPLGPEENIVEICHDFAKRHSTIEHFIPADLTIYGVMFRSLLLEEKFHEVIKSFDFSSYKCKSFSLGYLKKDFELEYCSLLQMGVLPDAIFIEEKKKIKKYILGKNKNSDFDAEFSFHNKKANGLYLFFESQLSKNVKLCNHPNNHFGHWYPLFLKKPANFETLSLSYQSQGRKLDIKWFK